MNFTQLDFNQAWIRHSMFKTRLRAYLLGGSGDTSTLTDPKLCSLATWLKEVAVIHKITSNSVLEISYLHEEVHKQAAKVVSLYKQNRVEEARSLLPQLETQDAQIHQALNDLQREIAA